jgi:pimeloyl-ACP methyl ester carboxylesterase
MSYFDKKTYATDDALAIGRAHCLREGWDDALVSFMQSGGFSPSAKVPLIRSPTLVLWGRQDKVLDPAEFVPKFMQALPDARLEWIEECGHVPHLEQPVATTDAIVSFLQSLNSSKGGKAERPTLGKEWVAPLVGLSALAAYAADFLPVR